MAETQKRRGLEERRDVLDAARFDIRSVHKEFRQLPIELLKPGFFQTRRNFNKKALDELAASLVATGSNFNPVIIRRLKHSDGYEIICGERRWRAAQQIGLPTLLCCVGDYTDAQAMYLSGADNIQREDLNPLEEAQAYALMLDAGMTQQDVADEIGKSRSLVANYLRLLSLPLVVRDLLGHDKLNFAQARPLCGLSAKPARQIEIAQLAVARHWSSQKIEDEVSKLNAGGKQPKRAPAEIKDADIRRLCTRLSEQTGYPWHIAQNKNGEWELATRPGSLDGVQDLIARLGYKDDSF